MEIVWVWFWGQHGAGGSFSIHCKFAKVVPCSWPLRSIDFEMGGCPILNDLEVPQLLGNLHYSSIAKGCQGSEQYAGARKVRRCSSASAPVGLLKKGAGLPSHSPAESLYIWITHHILEDSMKLAIYISYYIIIYAWSQHMHICLYSMCMYVYHFPILNKKKTCTVSCFCCTRVSKLAYLAGRGG